MHWCGKEKFDADHFWGLKGLLIAGIGIITGAVHVCESLTFKFML